MRARVCHPWLIVCRVDSIYTRCVENRFQMMFFAGSNIHHTLPMTMAAPTISLMGSDEAGCTVILADTACSVCVSFSFISCIQLHDICMLLITRCDQDYPRILQSHWKATASACSEGVRFDNGRFVNGELSFCNTCEDLCMHAFHVVIVQSSLAWFPQCAMWSYYAIMMYWPPISTNRLSEISILSSVNHCGLDNRETDSWSRTRDQCYHNEGAHVYGIHSVQSCFCSPQISCARHQPISSTCTKKPC